MARRDPNAHLYTDALNTARTPRTAADTLLDEYFPVPAAGEKNIASHIYETLYPDRVKEGRQSLKVPFLSFRYELAQRSRGDLKGAQFFAEKTATPEAPAPVLDGAVDELMKAGAQLRNDLFHGGEDDKKKARKIGKMLDSMQQAGPDPLDEAALKNYVDRLRAATEVYYRQKFGQSIMRYNPQINNYEPAKYGDEDLKRDMLVFDQQWENAQRGLKGEKIELSELNMETPERQLLWAAALAHRHRPQAGAGTGKPGSPPDFFEDKFVEAIKKSRFVEHSMETFAKYAMPLMPPSAGKEKIYVRWGKPGSWFYCTMPDKKDPGRLVNIDLVMAMISGGARRAEEVGELPLNHVRANWQVVGYHEVGHAVMSHLFPEKFKWALDEEKEASANLQAKLKAIPKGADGKRDHDAVQAIRADVKRYMLAGQRRSHYKQVWNAAEDIAVDRYAISLTDNLIVDNAVVRNKGRMKPEHKPPTQLDSSRNITKAMLSGTGLSLIMHANPSSFPHVADKDPASAESLLGSLAHFINMSFYRHTHLREGGSMRFFPDDERTWNAQGVRVDLLTGLDPSKDTPQALADLCQQIEEAYPRDKDGRLWDPIEIRVALQKLLAAQRENNQAQIDNNPLIIANKERNRIIDILLERYAEPLVQKLETEQQKEMEEQIDQALDDIEEGAEPKPGQPGSPQQGGGTPGMPGEEEGEGESKGEGKPPKGGEEIGNAAQGYDEAKDEKEGPDGESTEPKRKSDKPENKKADEPGSLPNKPDPNAPVSKGKPGPTGSSALKDIKFGDGTRLKEIMDSEMGKNAVSMIAAEMSALARKAIKSEKQLEPTASTYELKGGRAKDLIDQKAVMKWFQGGKSTIPKVVRRYRTVEVPSAPDFVIMIDGSPSMTASVRASSDNPDILTQNAAAAGHTRLTVAAQGSALCYKAMEQCNEAFRAEGKAPPYRMFMTMWGASGNWLGVKTPEDLEDKYIIIDPGNPAHTNSHAMSRIERIESGLNSGGTVLAPAVGNMAGLIGRQAPSQKDVRRGYTHFIIVTDGGVGDEAEVIAKITHMMKERPTSTVSVVLTGDLGAHEDQMTGILEKIKTLHPEFANRVGITHAKTVQEVPAAIYETMNSMVERTSTLKITEPDATYTNSWRQIGEDLLAPGKHTDVSDFVANSAKGVTPGRKG